MPKYIRDNQIKQLTIKKTQNILNNIPNKSMEKCPDVI